MSYVQAAERFYLRAMGQDDRADAIGWYCRRLVLQEIERGVQQAEIAEKAELTRPAITYVKQTGEGVGMKTAFRLARYFRRSPGELVDEAVDWWENRGGRAEAAAVMQALADERAAEAAEREAEVTLRNSKDSRPAKRQ